MLFAGFNVSNGEYSLWAAVAVGSLANLVGSWIAYWVGYAGRVDILEKHGKKLHIKKSHLEWADRWFERHGDATVFFTRMLPIIRTFISLPAGVARMPFWRFSLLTLAGCVPWVLMLTFTGKQAGRQLGGLEGQPALRGLRRGRAHRRAGSGTCSSAPGAGGVRARRPPRRPERTPAPPRGGGPRAAPGGHGAGAGVQLGAPVRGAPGARLHLSPARGRRAEVVRGGPPRRDRRRCWPPPRCARARRPRSESWPSPCSPRPLAGLVLERPIERRLGGPLGGGPGPGRRGRGPAGRRSPGRGARRCRTGADHLAVGVAQAAALVPGVSRAGRGAHGGRACAGSPARRRSRSRSRPPCRSPPGADRAEGHPHGAGGHPRGGRRRRCWAARWPRWRRRPRARGCSAGCATRARTRRWPPTGWPSALAAAAVGGKHHGRKIPGAGALSPLQ